MESNTEPIINPPNLIDGQALLDEFKIKNTSSFSTYLKSVWKDLSKRSEYIDKGPDMEIFKIYMQLPGLISTRLFDLFDKDNDGHLSYNEFSSGMKRLYNSSIDETIDFIFDLFDNDFDEYISSEDIISVFQYIPLIKSLPNQSIYDRIQSQDELQQTVFLLFDSNFKEKLHKTEFKSRTKSKSSTIFLYLSVFLLSKRPFSERTIDFYRSSSDISSVIEKRSPYYIPSPILTSKYSPSLKILKSPLLKKERENMKKEIFYTSTRESIEKVSIDDSNIETYLKPVRYTNNIGYNNYEIDQEIVDLLNQTHFERTGAEEVTFEGFILKIIDNKLKKLWFILFENYIYCKSYTLNIR